MSAPPRRTSAIEDLLPWNAQGAVLVGATQRPTDRTDDNPADDRPAYVGFRPDRKSQTTS
jgi:hypothetical protein